MFERETVNDRLKPHSWKLFECGLDSVLYGCAVYGSRRRLRALWCGNFIDVSCKIGTFLQIISCMIFFDGRSKFNAII